MAGRSWTGVEVPPPRRRLMATDRSNRSVPGHLHTPSRASPYSRRTNATDARTNGQPRLTSCGGMGDS